MILLTGAGGKTGRAVLKALAARGEEVRVIVHSGDDEISVRFDRPKEVLKGDMRSPKFMAEATQGVQAVYHICPNMHPEEDVLGLVAIQAAMDAGVERFAYHSVLHPQTESMPHHWNKLKVEQMLFESGLDFTILQPAPYMQNILAYWQDIRNEGRFTVPYAPETRLSLVDLDDVGKVAAQVLTESGHAGATYELVGTPPLTQIEIVETIGQALGKPVQAVKQPLDEWEQRARATRMSAYAIDTLKKMFEYYETFGLWGSPQTLTWLLKRPPSSLVDFVKRQAV